MFKKHPMIVFNCSFLEPSVKTGGVDVRLECDFSQAIPANTTAYCLIIHDEIFAYNPFSNIIERQL